MATRFNFEWDPVKAKANLRKHGVSFEQAVTVFRDPRAISVFNHDQAGAAAVRGQPMKREYDLSNGERGKFYHPDAIFNVPIYLEKEVLAYLSEKARSKGVELSQLINDILRRDIDLIEAVK